MTQSISCCIPRLIGIVNLDDVEFIKMEDLTRNCAAPAIMDIKLGSRTFILSEANNNLRHDLFNKVNCLTYVSPLYTRVMLLDDKGRSKCSG